MSAAGRLEVALRARNHGSLPTWFVSVGDAPGSDGLVMTIVHGAQEQALRGVAALPGGRGAWSGAAWWEGLPLALRESAAAGHGMGDFVSALLPGRGTTFVVGSLLGAAVGWWLRGRARAGYDGVVGAARKAWDATAGRIASARNPRAARRRPRRHGTSK